MSFHSLLVNTVTVSRPSVTYVKGVPTKSYASVVTELICNIQYMRGGVGGFGFGSQHTTEHGYEIEEGWFGAFEYGANVRKDDLLTDEKGREFIVKSSPQDVVGRKHHVECALAIQE